jgi:hypothetical protein
MLKLRKKMGKGKLKTTIKFPIKRGEGNHLKMVDS